MNKIYKVIWSKVKNCYVVVSELAKSRTKSPKSTVIDSLEKKINMSLCNGNYNIVASAMVLPQTEMPVTKNFKITVAAIVKNEAENVPQWVQAARSCADEIIVVDTGSTDGTVERFADYGIKCFHYDWHDDFAAAKNYMISLCHGDWIVLLDGDEWFREGCDVRKVIAKHHGNPITKAIIADWICLDKDRNNTVMFSSGAVRAFRNQPDVRYFRKVHENLTINYENFVFEPEFKMYHTGYSGSVNRSKHERNLRIMRTMFDFDNGKVEYPTDWRYIEDTYAGLGEFDKALWAADKMISYGVQDYSASAWVTKFNVLFAMKAPMERMEKEFEFCFRTVPSVSGFRFLASIYFARNGCMDKALDEYTEGVRMLMGPQDRVAMEHTFWRMYLPEASALIASVCMESNRIESALSALYVSEQYCGKTQWTDGVMVELRRRMDGLSKNPFDKVADKVLPLLQVAKRGLVVTAMASGIVVGALSNANDVFAASCNLNGVSGNCASGANATVTAGYCNKASGCYSSVSGGHNNTASNCASSVTGGRYNTASGCYSLVSGGCENTASGNSSTILGGDSNIAKGSESSIVGGWCNHSDGVMSSIFGGSANTASGLESTISGGHSNTASGCRSFVGGAWGGTASGQFSSVIGGGGNKAIGYTSLVTGGDNNTASGSYSFAAGGCKGYAYAYGSSVIGGGITGVSSCEQTARESVAIGKSAKTTKNYEVAIGSACAPVKIGGNLTVTGTQTVTDGSTTKKWSDILKAGNYTLPSATSSVLGGVKIGSNITVSSGEISLTKANVVAALGYTPPTADTNTTYIAGSGLTLSGTAFSVNTNGAIASGNANPLKGDTVFTEVRPTADGSFVKKANSTAANLTALDTASKNAIKNIALSGSTLTFTKGDNSTETVAFPEGKTYKAGTGLTLASDTFSVNANGNVVSGDTGIVTGGKVYDAITRMIQYDEGTNDTATLVGSSGTKLTNLKAGTLSKISTDAVTGAQLYATNQNIAGFATDINRNKTNIQNLNTSVTAALESVSASSQLVDIINNAKADKSLNNLDAAGMQVINNAAANAVQEYMANNRGVMDNTVASTSMLLSETPSLRALNPIRQDNTSYVTGSAVWYYLNGGTNAADSGLRLGDGSRGEGYVISLGEKAGDGTVLFEHGMGNYEGCNSSRPYSISIGYEAGGLFNERAVNIGYRATTLHNDSMAIGSGAVGIGGTAIGASALAVEGGTAFGKSASAYGQNSLALGNYSDVDGVGSIAVKGFTRGDYAISIGDGAEAGADIVIGGYGSYPDLSEQSTFVHEDALSYIYAGNRTIAIGKNAKAYNDDSIALGTQAAIGMFVKDEHGEISVAEAVGSIALGSNSFASENNVLSVGHKAGDNFSKDGVNQAFVYNTDLFRRIINVADGTDDHDVATVGQLNEAIANVNSGTNYGSGTGIVIDNENNIHTKNVLMYDTDDNDTASLAGNSGTKLTNLKQATLSNTSTDAVTGAQLYATNQNIAGFANDITRNKNNITNLNTSVTAALESVSASSQLVDVINSTKADKSLNNLDAAGQQVIANAAANAVQEYMATQEGTRNSVEENTQPVLMRSPFMRSVNPAPADTNYVVYDDAEATTVTLEGALGTGTKITNVARGELSAASTDAVNGQQLYEVTQHFDDFQSALSSNNTSIARAQTDINHMKTANIKLESDVNTLKTEMETGFNVTIDGAKVKTVNPANNQVDFKAGDGIAIENDNGSVKISLDADMTGFATKDDLDKKADLAYVDEQLGLKANASDVYTKDETDTLLSNKADKDSVYTKTETDELLVKKADVTYVDSEIKSVRDDMSLKADKSYVDKEFTNVRNDMDLKANKSDVYTKVETDDLFVGKETFTNALDKKANVDASNIDVNAWADKLGTGRIEEGNTGLVAGGTVYEALRNVKGSDMIAPDYESGSVRIAGDGRYDVLDSVDISKSDGSGRILRGVITDVNDPTSSANVGYVDAVTESMAKQVSASFDKMDTKINRVGANAAALAALTPASFEGDEKWSLAASVGNYRGETAGAVGAFYKPTENVMINVRGSFGNNESMVAGGVAVALTKGDIPGVTKRQLATTVNKQAAAIVGLQQEREQDRAMIAAQGEQLAAQANEIALLKAKMEEIISKKG